VPERSLIDAAKKEGTVVWYTALALNVSEQFAEIFQKAYGIHVELTPSGTSRMLTRVLQEAQAGVNATRLRLHRTPRARSSACTRGAP
jgi:iron(III) transport system substrate-binding protein